MFEPTKEDLAQTQQFRVNRSLIEFDGETVITQRAVFGVIYPKAIGMANIHVRLAQIIKRQPKRDKRKFGIFLFFKVLTQIHLFPLLAL
jgi:hypothetical protein